MTESRRGPRRRMLKHVQVLSLDKKATSAIDCTLRNISASGAQLSGPETSISRVPSEFYLVAPGQLRMIRGRVVWKSYDAVGICFLSDPGQLTSCTAEGDSREPLPERENCALDRTAGAAVKSGHVLSARAPENRFCDLEHTLSETLRLKVRIAETGLSGSRVVVHVETMQQLNEVCRRLARPD